MPETKVTASSPLLIAGAWIVVVVPAVWGLTYTVQNALKIFTKAPAAVSAPAVPGTGH